MTGMNRRPALLALLALLAQPMFAVREPVLRIKPKTVLISRTNFGPYYTEKGGAFPGEVGPFYGTGDLSRCGKERDNARHRHNLVNDGAHCAAAL